MRRSLELRGILVALVTPFTIDGRAVDEDGLRRHVDWLIEQGVHGLVPAGSTGECSTLSMTEHKRVIEIVVGASRGRVPVVPGTGALTTAAAVELSRHAAAAGADAVMVVPPYYGPSSLATVRAYLEDIAAAVPVPLVYYNVPGVTGTRLEPEDLASLGEIDGVEFLKDSSGDAVAFTELVLRHGDRITAFNGWDTLTFLGLALGAGAAFWGAANVIPREAVGLWEALAVRGDLEAGRRLWRQLWPVCDFFDRHDYVAAVKAGMDLIGRPAGPPRRPHLPLGTAEREDLAALLERTRIDA